MQRTILRIPLLPTPLRLLLRSDRNDATVGAKQKHDQEKFRGKSERPHELSVAETSAERKRSRYQ
jgi:hypothetical protein